MNRARNHLFSALIPQCCDLETRVQGLDNNTADPQSIAVKHLN